MYRLRAYMVGFAGLIVFVLMAGATAPGGCLGAGLVPSPGGQGGILKDDGVYQALRDAGSPSSTAVSTDDEAAYFGESAELYPSMPSQTQEVTSEDIAEEVTLGDGGAVIAHGRLAGRYWLDEPGGSSDEVGGIFRGRWSTGENEPAGVLRGEFMPLPPGQLPLGIVGGGILYGKFIDSEGQFHGVMLGRYGHTLGGRNLFFGWWLDREDQLVGLFKGHWTAEPGTAGGAFTGRWAGFNVCDEAQSLPEMSFDVDDLDGYEATDESLNAVAEYAPSGVTVEDVPVFGPEDDGSGQPPCIDLTHPHGRLFGWHWPVGENVPPEAHDGWFFGYWRTAGGLVDGILFGRYEDLDDPETRPSDASGTAAEGPLPGGQVTGRFWGKYVDLGGGFRGLVHGVYGRSANDLSVFRGRYIGRYGVAEGALLGRWANVPGYSSGPFGGIWFGADLNEAH